MYRYGRPLHLILLAGILIFLAGRPVHAQEWLAPANPDRSIRGPLHASGAIIWSHGRSISTEDSESPTPPYMARLRDGGWDTFRFNRMRDDDTLDGSAAQLVAEVRRLKARGYRKVALAGQSFGAFLSLIAADSSNQVDAVIATAPAAYGSFSEFYDSWRSNASQLYPLLARVKDARVMVFYFHGDDFDPGGRGDRTNEILDGRHLPHVVVDQPPGLTSHWAATTPLFGKRYGDCILGFLNSASLASGARCGSDGLYAGAEPTGPTATSDVPPIASSQGSAQELKPAMP
jgi:pimeloyl-ACP methyl ester carboxylesterase